MSIVKAIFQGVLILTACLAMSLVFRPRKGALWKGYLGARLALAGFFATMLLFYWREDLSIRTPFFAVVWMIFLSPFLIHGLFEISNSYMYAIFKRIVKASAVVSVVLGIFFLILAGRGELTLDERAKPVVQLEATPATISKRPAAADIKSGIQNFLGVPEKSKISVRACKVPFKEELSARAVVQLSLSSQGGKVSTVYVRLRHHRTQGWIVTRPENRGVYFLSMLFTKLARSC